MLSVEYFNEDKDYAFSGGRKWIGFYPVLITFRNKMQLVVWGFDLGEGCLYGMTFKIISENGRLVSSNLQI